MMCCPRQGGVGVAGEVAGGGKDGGMLWNDDGDGGARRKRGREGEVRRFDVDKEGGGTVGIGEWVGTKGDPVGMNGD